MIKTVALTGTEQEVTFAGTHTHYWVQNLGGGDILVGLDPELADGKDDVLIVPSGGAGYVRRDTGVKTVYLSGTGKAQVYGTNNAFSPFRTTPKGGDDITSDGSAITAGTVDYPLLALNLYGKSTQDGTPTPDVPAPIISVGDDGSVEVTDCGKNLLFQTCKSETINGVTFTVQPDGSIIMNGTSTDDVVFQIYNYTLQPNRLIFSGGEYTISFGDEFDKFAKNNTNLVFMVLGCHDNETNSIVYPVWINKGVITFASDDITNKREFSVRIRLYAGVVCDNVRIYPQIEKGTIATTYEPHTGNAATITSGLPLCSIGEYRDELIYNADGTGKIIKCTASVTFDGSQTITSTTINNTQLFVYRAEKRSAIKTLMCNCFTGNNLLFSQNNTCGIDGYTTYFRADGFSTADDFKTFAASNNLTIVYQLETPYEIELSATEMSELMQLQTFNGITNIYNDAGAEMGVKYCTNPLLSEFVKPIINGITARFEKRIAALEFAITSNT